MRGTNYVLALTTTLDEISGERKPLFAFPIQVCKAIDEGKDVKFDIAAPSGAARETVSRDSATKKEVAAEEIQHGVRVGDTFYPISQEQIDGVKTATQIKTLVAEGSMPLSDFFAEYGSTIQGRYYVQSPTKGGSHKAYRLTYESLLEVRKGKRVLRPAQVIVTKRTPTSRQKNCAIYSDPTRGCLVLVDIAFADAVVEPDDAILAPQTAQVTAEQIEMARTVVDNLPDARGFIASSKDEAIALKQALVDAAIMGETVAVPTPVSDTVQTDDLTSLLEASIKAAA